MQQFGSGSMLYEDNAYFGRSDTFPIDDTPDHSNCGSAFPGLDDTLERQLKASSFSLGDIGAVHIPDETVDTELHQSLQFQLDDNGQLLQDMLQQQHNQHALPSPSQQQSAAAASWEESIHVLQEMLLLQQQQAFQSQDNTPNFAPAFATSGPFSDRNTSSNFPGTKFPGESELLSLLQLPRCAASSLSGTCAISTALKKPMGPLGLLPLYSSGDQLGEGHHNSPMYDPHIPQQSYSVPFRNVLHNLPPTYSLSTKPILNRQPLGQQLDVEDKDTNLNDEGRQFTNSLFDFKRENNLAKAGESRGINHFATERQRREYLNEKYQTLRSLVPNPTKADRASIVQDAIEYVKELKRTVQELQLLVQDKRRGGVKKRKADDGATDMESSSHPTLQRGQDILLCDGSQLRSSWLQRTSQHGTQVDVRIVDDEVNIKLIQKRRRNCLLNVVVMLHELRLDILHANGASIGEHHIYMFNAKMMEGSSTYAGHIAAKLIEAVDRQFATYLVSSYGILLSWDNSLSHPHICWTF